MKYLKRAALPLIFWLALWQLAALAVGKDLLLPGPVTVLATLGRLAATAQFWQITALSLLRIFAGLLAGVVLGAAWRASGSLWASSQSSKKMSQARSMVSLSSVSVGSTISASWTISGKYMVGGWMP